MNKKPDLKLTSLSHTLTTVDIQDEKLSESFWLKVAEYQFIISIIGMIIGGFFILLGAILTIIGEFPSSEWLLQLPSFTSKIQNATPGVILIIIGLVTIYFSRFKIRSLKTIKK